MMDVGTHKNASTGSNPIVTPGLRYNKPKLFASLTNPSQCLSKNWSHDYKFDTIAYKQASICMWEWKKPTPDPKAAESQ